MSTRFSVSATLALTLTLLAAKPAHAQMLLGPAGKPSYIEVHGEMFRTYDGVDAPVGGSIEFGTFQNKYIAMGTILGLESPGRGTGLPDWPPMRSWGPRIAFSASTSDSRHSGPSISRSRA
jgi:hypothetical protein